MKSAANILREHGLRCEIKPPASIEVVMSKQFDPIKYVVPGVIVEGLTLFASKPKLGKSWLLLHAAIAVARGGFTLGEIHCVEGDVLYAALEDNEQSRMKKLLGSQPEPRRLFYTCEMPRLTEGGLDYIGYWITGVPQPRLVIIDTLAMVRTPKQRDETNYDADYRAVLDLRTLASKDGVAVVVVHHLRKAEADDAFDTVSGTLGLTGVPLRPGAQTRKQRQRRSARSRSRSRRNREGDAVQPRLLYVGNSR